ncbi:ABC transporter ATP-binding protein [Thalassomonas viridans]|uniref:ABC transporter ATP-binding protein n=1 Tax=Thalassomonas viridans TaxID=137584 RepID=A0AAF0C8X1_9GAMM|nr:ABC transporter ATP-binding protein [Thalassomonas viridans]WDE04635.1 ABC transporter ATP-binding protein [Thalassomonas viridans]
MLFSARNKSSSVSGSAPAAAGVPELSCDHVQENHIKPRFYHSWGVFFVFKELTREPGLSWLMVLSALSALLSGPFILSAYLEFAVNKVIYSQDLSLFLHVTFLVFILILFGGLTEFYGNKIAARANSRICHQLVLRNWQRLMYTPAAVFSGLKKSELTSVLTDTLETLQKHQLFVLQNSLRSLFVMVFTVGILLSYHVLFLLLVVFFMLLTCLLPIYIAKGADPYIEQEPGRLADVNGFLSSALAAQTLLKTRDLTGIVNKFKQLLLALATTQAGKWLIWNFSFNVKVTLNLLSHISILWLGGELFFRGVIALGDLVVVYVLSSMVVPRLDSIYKIYNYSQSLAVCYRKLEQLTPEKSPLLSSGKVSAPAEKITSLRLEQVGFSYLQAGSSGASKPVFSGLDLDFSPGNSYLITGASGSGKSTLIDLLSAVLTPDSGRLMVNGKPLLPEDKGALWQRLSLHDQSNLALKQGRVLDNINLFGREVNQERFQLACRLLNFTDCLHKPVTELSGGELQRLCFIRCYVRDADLYIFDEPTASLDAGMEQQVVELLAYLDNVIVVVISHNKEIKTAFDYILHVYEQGVQMSALAPAIELGTASPAGEGL